MNSNGVFSLYDVQVDTYTNAIPYRADYPPSHPFVRAIHLPTGIVVEGRYRRLVIQELECKVNDYYSQGRVNSE